MTGWICLLGTMAAAMTAAAQLPMLHDREWQGYFAVHETSRSVFVVRADGEILLIPRGRDKEWVAIANRIRIDYGIEEVLPGGGTVSKQTRPGSLESADEATGDIDKLVIRGTSTGDARYELVIEQSRDVVSVGGRVVDAGRLTGHPLRFAVRVSLPNVYRRVEVTDREDEREFAKLARRDYLEVVRIDRSRVSLTHDDSGVMDGQVLTGSGVEEIEMRLSYYEGRRFFFSATRDSGIAISAPRSPGPWYEGMTLHWTEDPSKDPGGRGRLKLCVK